MPYILGIDIGGTKIAGGVVDAGTGTVLFQDRVPTLAREGGPAVLQRALTLANRLQAEATEREAAPVAVGVGAGGQIDPESGMVLSATEVLPGWAGTRLKQSFEDGLQLPCAVENDVNALAVGESRFGAGQGYRNLVYLALGTGVGGALILDGRLYHSRTGVSGELGHLILYPNGHPCTCGGKGCLEQYCSGPALWRHFADLGGRVSPEENLSLAERAEREPYGAAARAIGDVGHFLGLGLVSLANILGPDRFIIGGGLADLGNRLLNPARQVVLENAMPAVKNIPVVAAALGPDAPIIGAASLASLPRTSFSAGLAVD